ncbi:RNA chaperone Hfq [Xenorhabdus sp. PR6a]|uniref:RNA chaperone Hfq n=1 Tax=Xenorhabdus sp. PR6a TaxID=3025877 RepID=UPI002358DF57|nr:RNA chaperone Hfq [Xenorhabdus sp. PR6a]MDC9583073.1 RNA chaperone Hfq [Xenorhabdus sp. PR6a]
MNHDYEIIKSRLSWLKFNNVPIEIVTNSGNKISGFVRKFDDLSVLVDEAGHNDLNTFKTVNYSSIESVQNLHASAC